MLAMHRSWRPDLYGGDQWTKAVVEDCTSLHAHVY
jgi:hypothetical protein